MCSTFVCWAGGWHLRSRRRSWRASQLTSCDQPLPHLAIGHQAHSQSGSNLPLAVSDINALWGVIQSNQNIESQLVSHSPWVCMCGGLYRWWLRSVLLWPWDLCRRLVVATFTGSFLYNVQPTLLWRTLSHFFVVWAFYCKWYFYTDASSWLAALFLTWCVV